MVVDLRELPPEGLDLDLSLALPEARDERVGALVVGRASLQGRLDPGDDGAVLAARFGARVRLECGRCLEPFEKPVEGRFSLRIVGEAVEFGSGETEVEADDAELYYASGGQVDLAAILTEQLYLGLPLKAVCIPGCAGLCPTCGANRNRLECGCRSTEVDPRLAALQDIKQKMEDS